MERESKGDIDKLPRAMKELIFGKLSIRSICSSRIVCKKWNSILSSQSFLFSLPTQNPWLLICSQENDGNWHCMAYCFSEQKWMALPLSFIPNSEGRNITHLSNMGQGLLLFSEIFTPQLFVCNPLLRSYAKIEIDLNLSQRFIHIVQGGNKEPYLIVGSDFEMFSFEIYHYFQDAWRIKYLLETGCNILCRIMVECNGVIFGMGITPGAIVGYNIKEEGSVSPVTVAPLPGQAVQDLNVHVLYMVSYGSSVLVVGFLEEPLQQLADGIGPFPRGIHPFIAYNGFAPTRSNMMGIVIWELFQDEEDKLLWNWKEFARMPPQLLSQYLNEDWWCQQCVCVGDYLCLSSLYGDESASVLAYNLKEGFWQRLPLCKIQCNKRTMMLFEPKLNLYQFLGKLRE
ncbi:hypothetical protein SUGI_0043750 [Cryptomeria japonica]|uniref:F-box/kelch-repeat protein At5g15710 n=1 Tax=Cryptomeria japonica TaxID=3369 RepID=UPI002408E23E|nr:F-box/kelch-repeat protein At5g15710 [Cryptomeria japonica]GLJ06636.1 hypothetical protein SUGI_0043750 [Cryptomeria japonica]